MSDAISDARQTVQAFLEGWKPFAQLPPGNPARRHITRFIETDDAEARGKILARQSLLYRLQQLYGRLGMKREDGAGTRGQFRELINMPLAEMARAVAANRRKEFAELLQGGFEFGRGTPKPRIVAVRRFLLELLTLPVLGGGMKYSIYPNGVLYSGGGLTHEEMAKKFNDLGLGQGNPLGGGEIQRPAKLAFIYDVASTAFVTVMKPEFVKESLLRWVYLTGGMEERVAFEHREKLGPGV